MNNIGVPVLIIAFIVSLIIMSIVPVSSTQEIRGYDYSRVLDFGVRFYDAQKCGNEVRKDIDDLFRWRNNCHTSDGTIEGIDLIGGFHTDEGYSKNLLIQGYSASIIAWSFLEFTDVYNNSMNSKKTISTLKYFTDFFLKCHPNPTKFIYQVGDDNSETWVSPEIDESNANVNTRSNRGVSLNGKTFVVNLNTPQTKDEEKTYGADVVGIVSSSLSMMSIICKDSDKEYSAKCLKAAKELYDIGRSGLGCAFNQGKYPSDSFFDDLSWAAFWLSKAENNNQYLNDINDYLTKASGEKDIYKDGNTTMNWNSMYLPLFLKLGETTNDKKYLEALINNFNYWRSDSVKTSKEGLKIFSEKDNLANVLSEVTLMVLFNNKWGNNEDLKSFCKQQVDYMLGSNSKKKSYVIGVNSNWPLRPYSYAANGYTKTNDDYKKEAKNKLLGALVGGPDIEDKFYDSVTKPTYTSVSICNNANLVAAMAAMSSIYDSNVVEKEKEEETEILQPISVNIVNVENGKQLSNISKEDPLKINFDFNPKNEEMSEAILLVNNEEYLKINSAPYEFNWYPKELKPMSIDFIVKLTTKSGKTAISNNVKANLVASDSSYTISIFNPSDKQSILYKPNVPINLSADVKFIKNDKKISRVEFYINNEKVGQATTAPYSYSWKPKSIVSKNENGLEEFKLYAKAFSSDGKNSSSSVITFNIKYPK